MIIVFTQMNSTYITDHWTEPNIYI